MASVLALLFNVVEIYSDKYKLVKKLYQRQLPSKVQGLGTWVLMFYFVSILSIYTNVMLCGFNYYKLFDNHSPDSTKISEHLNTILSVYDDEPQIQQLSKDEIQDKMVITFFVVEHMLLGFVWLLCKSVPEIPKWVKIFIKRKSKIKPSFGK